MAPGTAGIQGDHPAARASLAAGAAPGPCAIGIPTPARELHPGRDARVAVCGGGRVPAGRTRAGQQPSARIRWNHRAPGGARGGGHCIGALAVVRASPDYHRAARPRVDGSSRRRQVGRRPPPCQGQQDIHRRRAASAPVPGAESRAWRSADADPSGGARALRNGQAHLYRGLLLVATRLR